MKSVTIERYSNPWDENDHMQPDKSGGWVSYADHAAEVKRLEQERDEARNSVKRTREWLTEAQHRVGSHLARIAELEEVLEPFAAAAEDISLIEDDQENVLQHPTALNITFGHLRTAHAKAVEAKSTELVKERDEARRLLHKAIEGPWTDRDLQVARDFLNKEPESHD